MDKNIKLLVFDIDGTLIDRDKLVVEESAVEAINQAKENGFLVLIATGRTFFFIHDDVKQRILPEYYVTTNGACLTDVDGNILEEYSFDKDELKDLIEYTRAHNYPLGVKYPHIMATYHNHDEYVERYVGKLNHSKAKFVVDDQDFKIFNSQPAHGIYLFAPHETESVFEQRYPNLGIVQAENIALEIFPEGVDKTKTIDTVVKKLNLTWDNVMTFGDGHNDVFMLEKAALGVAMGNVDDYVKSHADYTTTDILDNGISNALKHFNII